MKNQGTFQTSSTCSSNSSEDKSSLSSISPISQADHDKFNRLYERSENRRIEGRKRRMEIQKALKAKEEPPIDCGYKISPKEAEKMYYRGVKQLLDLDSRRLEIAKTKQVEYQPYRFGSALREKALKSHVENKNSSCFMISVIKT